MESRPIHITKQLSTVHVNDQDLGIKRRMD